MLAPLRRTIVYFMEFLMGKKEPLISSEVKESSPEMLKDDYVRDSKIVSSVATETNKPIEFVLPNDNTTDDTSPVTVELDDSPKEEMRYNLRERKPVKYSEESPDEVD
jgi:hypothetical protein